MKDLSLVIYAAPHPTVRTHILISFCRTIIDLRYRSPSITSRSTALYLSQWQTTADARQAASVGVVTLVPARTALYDPSLGTGWLCYSQQRCRKTPNRFNGGEVVASGALGRGIVTRVSLFSWLYIKRPSKVIVILHCREISTQTRLIGEVHLDISKDSPIRHIETGASSGSPRSTPR
jgi:hypothetical protein